ncbi:MAG: DUF4835 family protein [Saprospiraceae bacterium]|nr:DUF4835 family protein [Saprospiraceae bacterium]
MRDWQRNHMAFVLLSILGYLGLPAQEFNMQIDVNAPTLQTADPALFEELEGKLIELINTRRWTNESYEEHERIKGNINLTVSELSSTTFSGELSIQAIRPVFGSNYETTLLNHLDKEFIFQFEQTTPLIYSENIFTDNLTSVFAFYMFYILGLDHDSFVLYGGDRYYQLANEIVNTLPTALLSDTKSGWSSKSNGRNRYFMIENILSPRSRPYRKALYEYHRKGIDVMHRDVEGGKNVLVSALKDVQTVNKDYPNSMIVQMFANAKAQEVADIFAVGARPQKNEVYQIMTSIDPANRNKYIPIRR